MKTLPQVGLDIMRPRVRSITRTVAFVRSRTPARSRGVCARRVRRDDAAQFTAQVDVSFALLPALSVALTVSLAFFAFFDVLIGCPFATVPVQLAIPDRTSPHAGSAAKDRGTRLPAL